MRVVFARMAHAPIPGAAGYSVEVRVGVPFVYDVDDVAAAALIAAGVALDATGESYPTVPLLGDPPADLFVPPPPPPDEGDGLE